MKTARIWKRQRINEFGREFNLKTTPETEICLTCNKPECKYGECKLLRKKLKKIKEGK